MVASLTVTDNSKEVVQLLDGLRHKEILVGLPEDVVMEGVLPGQMNLAARAYISDNGAPEANIPQREFMCPGVERRLKPIADALAKAARAATAGGPEQRQQQYAFLARCGHAAVAGIREQIREGEYTPLHPYTLERRKAAGITGTDPLYATGAMYNAMTFIIKDQGKNIEAPGGDSADS